MWAESKKKCHIVKGIKMILNGNIKRKLLKNTFRFLLYWSFESPVICNIDYIVKCTVYIPVYCILYAMPVNILYSVWQTVQVKQELKLASAGNENVKYEYTVYIYQHVM